MKHFTISAITHVIFLQNNLITGWSHQMCIRISCYLITPSTLVTIIIVNSAQRVWHSISLVTHFIVIFLYMDTRNECWVFIQISWQTWLWIEGSKGFLWITNDFLNVATLAVSLSSIFLAFLRGNLEKKIEYWLRWGWNVLFHFLCSFCFCWSFKQSHSLKKNILNSTLLF